MGGARMGGEGPGGGRGQDGRGRGQEVGKEGTPWVSAYTLHVIEAGIFNDYDVIEFPLSFPHTPMVTTTC